MEAADNTIGKNNKEGPKVANRVRVLQLIRNANDITRSEIISKTGLSAPTVTRIIEDLTDRKLIVQDEVGSSRGGRPPQIIRFESKANYVIGIDLAGNYVRGALSNLDGEFSYEIQIPVHIEDGYESVMKLVGDLILKLVNRANSKDYRLFGIGMSVCGLVNRHTGILRYSPIFNWENRDIKKSLRKCTSLPIEMENAAHLTALAESLYGIGKNYKSFININLAYGIGSGIIINNQPFFGSDGFAGELGHIVVDHKSDRKGRENINGTLEALASGYGITDMAMDLLKKGRESSLSNLRPEQVNIETIIEAVNGGDKIAIQLIDEAANHVGIGIDAMIKLFNPEAITLSGEMVDNRGYFLKKVREKIDSITLPIYKPKIPILPSSFGEEASLMGAFSLILQRILKLE